MNCIFCKEHAVKMAVAPDKSGGVCRNCVVRIFEKLNVEMCLWCWKEFTNDDYKYAVTNEVWAESGFPFELPWNPEREPHYPPSCFLHMECLEKAIGRKLKPEDFNSGAWNLHEKSPALRRGFSIETWLSRRNGPSNSKDSG